MECCDARDLYGQKFTVETDHKSLSWLNQMKDTNARLTRWALQIQPYKFELKYQKGSENANTDGLSRISHDEEGLPKESSTIEHPCRHLIIRGKGCDKAL